ncbi:MAG: L,D-transpeptidase family protein [Thermomicrobiales bacterium]
MRTLAIPLSRGSWWRILPLLCLLIPLLGASPVAAQQNPLSWSAPRTVYVPETGQSVDGYFLDVWRSWGITGLGYPITPEITENGHIVQYYQFARLEYWPEDPNGDVVKYGAIGRELKPVTLFRNIAPGEKADDASHPSKALALELRAWLPLTDRSTTKPNTDTWRYVPETQHSIQGGFKQYWEATGEAAFLGFPITEEYSRNGITYQTFEYGQLAWTPGRDVWEIPVGEVLAQRYGLTTEPQPQGNLPIYSEDLFIPPPPWWISPNAGNATGEKWIQIDLSTQYMTVWHGNTRVAESFVSTGRERFATPPGTFFVNYKLISQTMSGVLGGEYYNVPDVPWVMYFTNRGHAIHGAYWHNNFGAVMSHGCVNLPVEFAEWLYQWSPSGMRIEIQN